MPPDTLYFLSDYGLADEFVGVVHAVLQRSAPGATVIDLTHQIPPFDVRAGAAALVRSVPHLGTGVVLAVVDPGVGGPRRGLVLATAAQEGPRYLVGPDNGLLVGAAERLGGVTAAWSLDPFPGAASRAATFDGRDLFAPAAGALAAGASPERLGLGLEPAEVVRLPEPLHHHRVAPDGEHSLLVEVLSVDRFGNVELAAPGATVPSDLAEAAVAVGEGGPEPARRVRFFDELAPGELGLITDAGGSLALVERRSSAAQRRGLSPGDVVTVTWPGA